MKRTSFEAARRVARVVALTGLCTAAIAAGPDGYPTHPVTVVVPFAPGGGSDIIARLVVARLSERTGGTYVIANKPGAGTNIGNEFVARAAADGYTLLFGQVTLSINPAIYKDLRYDVQKTFVPVAHFADSPTVLLVNADFPSRTLKEFVAYAKANPGKINFGSGGRGTSVHLAGELFGSVVAAPMVHVPYKGSAPAATDLMAGQIQAMFDTAPSALNSLKSGRVRALAVTGPKRLVALPDVPTFAEAGLPQFDAPAWYGLLAPAGTPAAIVRYLNGEIDQVLAEPVIRERLQTLGAIAVGGPPTTFATFIRTETGRWQAVVRDARIEPE